MADVIVGKQVVNKAGVIGTIISLENNYIHVAFGTRVVKFMDNAFDEGFLKYVEAELQAEVDDRIAQVQQAAKQKADREQRIKDKAQQDRLFVQQSISKTEFKTVVLAANIRLDPASVTFNNVRKRDQALIQDIFAECDMDTTAAFASFHPKMEYSRGYYSHSGTSKYCVGFVTKHLNTYVFRVFARVDWYTYSPTNGVTIKNSDTTEILRVLRVNDRDYYFSKNISFVSKYFSLSRSFNNWHVSNVNNTILLNEVIPLCDCGYLSDAIRANHVECLHYLKLLFPAFYNSKAEVVFKNKAFGSALGIDDLCAYLEEFPFRHVDYASKHDALNTLPLLKRFGLLEEPLLQHVEALMRKQKNGRSVYQVLKDTIASLGLSCDDLDARIISFIKKVERFNASLYCDYITMLARYPEITIQDFFDKDYIGRHYIMLDEQEVKVSDQQREQYRQAAEELKWIDREENNYYIFVPKTIDEFMYEGNVQHNCVYTCRYFDQVIQRLSIIVFLREKRNAPYVTIEFDYETFCVYQAYGKFNQDIDDELYQYVVELGKRLYRERLSWQ